MLINRLIILFLIGWTGLIQFKRPGPGLTVIPDGRMNLLNLKVGRGVLLLIRLMMNRVVVSAFVSFLFLTSSLILKTDLLSGTHLLSVLVWQIFLRFKNLIVIHIKLLLIHLRLPVLLPRRVKLKGRFMKKLSTPLGPFLVLQSSVPFGSGSVLRVTPSFIQVVSKLPGRVLPVVRGTHLKVDQLSPGKPVQGGPLTPDNHDHD